MMIKKSILLIVATLLLLSAVLAGCKGFPPLSAKRKAEIEEAYKIQYNGNANWWDENGYDRIPTLFRYFDTYGDCIVLLRYTPTPSDWFGNPIDPPYILDHLTRPVEYPASVCSTGNRVIAKIWLYNTNPDCPKDSNNPAYPRNLKGPLATMEGLHERGLTWLTDEELEQLTTDLENWLAEGNY